MREVYLWCLYLLSYTSLFIELKTLIAILYLYPERVVLRRELEGVLFLDTCPSVAIASLGLLLGERFGGRCPSSIFRRLLFWWLSWRSHGCFVVTTLLLTLLPSEAKSVLLSSLLLVEETLEQPSSLSPFWRRECPMLSLGWEAHCLSSYSLSRLLCLNTTTLLT